MTNIVAVLIVRCTHTGFYKDGRPNPASVTLYDLDEITIQKNRTRAVPVTAGSYVDIPMSTRTLVSYHEGAICKHVKNGEITAEVILQLRDKSNCGGPAGTGQALRPAVANIERVANELRLVIPNNVIPTILDSIGFLVGEPLTITGLTGAFRNLNGEYEISAAAPSFGLGGADAGSYLVTVPSVGPDIASTTLAGANLCLTEGRVVSQFGSGGDVGGLGTNVFGYIGGQLFPNAGGGGGGSVTVLDEGALVDAAATSFDFVGAGVTATGGAGAVTITIPGGGGGGAPVGAEYLVLTADPTLTDERVFTAGTGISVVDGGAGGAFTVSVDATWAEILANGAASGGTSPIISAGDSLLGATDLILAPGAGAGDNIILDGLTWPGADGTPGQVLTTDGAGTLSFSTPSGTTAILEWGNNSVANSTATRYLDPGFEARTAPLATAVNSFRVPRAGTLRNLYLRHNNPGGSGATITYTVRVNGVATALTIGLASTGSAAADTTNTVAVVAGDYVDIEVTKAAVAGGGARRPMASVEVAA